MLKEGRRWVRVREGVYEWQDGAKVLATVTRHPTPMSGHFSVWKVAGVTGAQFPTKRDAQHWVEDNTP